MTLDPDSAPPAGGRSPRRLGWYVFAIVLLAFAARVGVAGLGHRFGVGPKDGLATAPAPGSDEDEYDSYAWNLARGNGYRGPSPDVADRDHLTAYRPPGPSALMAGVYAVAGHRYEPVRLVHCLLGALSVWMTYRIGRATFGPAVALPAAAVYAVYPTALLQSADLLSEPLGVFLFLVFLEAALRFAARPTAARAGWAGFVLGLCLLTRANYVFVLPLYVVWVLWQFRGAFRAQLRGLGVLAVAAAVLSPWVARNYLVFGEFIPFSTLGGSALLMGNNRVVVSDPKYYGFDVWDTTIPEYRETLQTAGDEVERDRRARRLAVQWLRDNPDQWGKLVWHKFVRSWNPWLAHNPSAAVRLVYLVTWGPILVLSAVAYFPTLVRALRARDPLWIIHLVILHYVANCVVFFVSIRYRAPVDPLCILLATWTVVTLRARWGSRGDPGPARPADPPGRADWGGGAPA